MNIEKINIWLGLVANVSVIAGIALLAVELNQNSDMMAAQTRNEITQQIIGIMEQQGEPSYSEALLLLEAGETLSPEQSRILGSVISQTLRHWENVYFQYERGLFSEDEFAGLRAYIKDSIEGPLVQELWQMQKQYYSQAFQEFITSLTEI